MVEEDPSATGETLFQPRGSATLLEIRAIRVSLGGNLTVFWGHSRGANLSRDLRVDEGGNAWEPLGAADDGTVGHLFFRKEVPLGLQELDDVAAELPGVLHFRADIRGLKIAELAA